MSYSEDCDYLRSRFEMPETISLYQLVHVITAYFKSLDNKETLKEQPTIEIEISKEKKECQKKKETSKLNSKKKKQQAKTRLVSKD